jgi:hypothetical protein
MLLIFLISLGALGFAARGRHGRLPVQRHGRAVASRLDQIALDHYPCARTVVYLGFGFRVSGFKLKTTTCDPEPET